jgi:hypothetical protein
MIKFEHMIEFCMGAVTFNLILETVVAKHCEGVEFLIGSFCALPS